MSTITSDDLRAVFKSQLEEPLLSPRLRCNHLMVARSTIQKYEKLARENNLIASDVVLMTDEQLNNVFNLHNKTKSFIEPKWDEVQNYLEKPRCWGNKLNTVGNAWRYKYVLEYFPNYKSGLLPPNCMSQRTFERRYNEYLESSGLNFRKQSNNCNLNYGPGSMVEIDTIGDRFSFIDAQGINQKAVFFTAVLKYSGLAYMRAMPNSTSMQWGKSIISMCEFFGGPPQVLRCDNDVAICIHGNR